MDTSPAASGPAGEPAAPAAPSNATELARSVLQGDRRSLARLLTRIENRDPSAGEALRQLYARTGRAVTTGITGAPGAGKSTLVFALAAELRRRNRRVGILAVDPSSPFTRGAILGDRVRMQGLTGDDGVFIRSMATRGALGGLAAGTVDAIAALDAFGMDAILVETVGAGQDEVDVMQAVQTVIVVEIPGTGDSVQSLKAGILEIADIYIVNKADREGADAQVANLRQLLSLQPPGRWRVPVLKTIAITGEGIAEVADAIDGHQAFLRESGELDRRRREHTRFQVLALARAALMQRLVRAGERDGLLTSLVREVAGREKDPYAAADRLIEALRTDLESS